MQNVFAKYEKPAECPRFASMQQTEKQLLHYPFLNMRQIKKNVGFFLTIYTPFTDIYITLQPVIFKCNKTVIPDLRQMFELQSNTGGVPICHLQAQHSRRALGLLVVFRS